ncbi:MULTISPECIES: hypothetical protein [Rhodococcus]|uniref:hypothetical protein n=1 Tax=Rhodococcus TaxID=1827 RepID=UPI00167CFC6E|nr:MULTISPECIES: hypothetical protein [Rhodococcus]
MTRQLVGEPTYTDLDVDDELDDPDEELNTEFDSGALADRLHEAAIDRAMGVW